MRKTRKMMAAFLTAPLMLALAYTAVRAPISVYAAAQEPLGVSSEADSPESGGGGRYSRNADRRGFRTRGAFCGACGYTAIHHKAS